MPDAAEQPPLIAVSNFLHPPFSSRDADGNAVGIEVDVIEMAAHSLGRRVEWRELAFAELLNAVASDEADIAAATIGVTEPRKRLVAFTKPYFQTEIVALTRPGGGEPATLDALRGKRVATDRGTTAVEATVKRIPEAIRVLVRPAGRTWAQMLLAGEVDAIVLDRSHVSKFTADAGVDLQLIDEPLREEFFALAVGLDATDLRAALDRVIEKRSK
jgi:polar amino acid transport system substrate-binding protein